MIISSYSSCLVCFTGCLGFNSAAGQYWHVKCRHLFSTDVNKLLKLHRKLVVKKQQSSADKSGKLIETFQSILWSHCIGFLDCGVITFFITCSKMIVACSPFFCIVSIHHSISREGQEVAPPTKPSPWMDFSLHLSMHK